MRIIQILIISVVVITLGVVGYLEKLVGWEISHTIYIILLAIFLAVPFFSICRQIKSEVKVSELELKANTIQSIQLNITIKATTAEQQISEKETSVGLSSAVALFTKDKTRYRFVTNYQYSIQQVSENTKCLNLIYQPEDPTQLCGKPIDFLNNIDVFVCNYSSFFQSAGFNPGLTGNPIDITVFINGVDVIAIRDKVASPGTLAGGQAALDISKEFANISDAYSERIRKKQY